MARDTLTARDLENRCQLTEKAVLQLGLATDKELAAHRPGGDNIGVEEWLKYFVMLQRRHAKLEHDRTDSPSHAEADRQLSAALRDEPKRVPIQSEIENFRADEQGPFLFTVYPKSFHALLTLAAHDFALEKLQQALEFCYEEDTAKSVDQVGDLLREIAYRHALSLWIVNAGDDRSTAALPYNDKHIFPEVPLQYFAIGPSDVGIILQAYYHVNAVRLRYLEQLMLTNPKQSGQSRRKGWALFFTDAADVLEIEAAHLYRETSLTGLVAQLHLNADSKRHAHQEAERTAKAKRGKR